MRTCLPILMLAAALLCGALLIPAAASQPGHISSPSQEETTPAPTATEEGQEAEAERIPPGPKDITERIATYVFLGWLWLSILVLIYALRLKIRESDRLHDLAYFDTDKETSQQGT